MSTVTLDPTPSPSKGKFCKLVGCKPVLRKYRFEKDYAKYHYVDVVCGRCSRILVRVDGAAHESGQKLIASSQQIGYSTGTMKI